MLPGFFLREECCWLGDVQAMKRSSLSVLIPRELAGFRKGHSSFRVDVENPLVVGFLMVFKNTDKRCNSTAAGFFSNSKPWESTPALRVKG